MAAAARLNRGLLVRGDHVVVETQALALPGAGIEVEHAPGLGGEVGIAGEDPASVGPGSDGVGGEPAPDGGAGDLGHETAADHLGSDVWHVQPGQRDAELSGQLTREGFDLDHDLGGERPWDDLVAGVPRGP